MGRSSLARNGDSRSSGLKIRSPRAKYSHTGPVTTNCAVPAEHVHDVRDDLADQRQVVHGLVVAAPQAEQPAHVGRADADGQHGVGVPAKQVTHGEQLADPSLGVNGLRRLEHRHAVERQPGFCPDFGQNLEEFRSSRRGEFRENKSGQNGRRRANLFDQRPNLIGMPDPHEQQRRRCAGPLPLRLVQLGQLRSDIALGGRARRYP